MSNGMKNFMEFRHLAFEAQVAELLQSVRVSWMHSAGYFFLPTPQSFFFGNPLYALTLQLFVIVRKPQCQKKKVRFTNYTDCAEREPLSKVLKKIKAHKLNLSTSSISHMREVLVVFDTYAWPDRPSILGGILRWLERHSFGIYNLLSL